MPMLLKIRVGPFQNASRDHRELAAAREAGYEVKALISAVLPRENGTIAVINEIEAERFHPYPKSLPFEAKQKKTIFEKAIRLFLRRIWGTFRWARKVKIFQADVISCHDLPALVIGYLSVWFAHPKKRPKLVYDSHEFELGRNASRHPLHVWLIKRMEYFLMRRCVFSIMVNDSIADEVSRVHKLKTRPLVVRNIPPHWAIDPMICAARRQEMIQAVQAGDNPFLVMYHGGIIKNRGIETLIQVVALNRNINGIILGYALDEKYLDELKQLVAAQGVADRVLFMPAVPIEQLWEYAGAVDVGVMLIENTCMNHYYSLPNKFFENIQSLTPIIAADNPEMRRLIDRYQIGLTCDQTDLEAINDCIEKMRTDKAFYSQLKHNLKAAKNDLCWEKEKQALIDAYRALLPQE